MRTQTDRDAAREVADLRRETQRTLDTVGRLAREMLSELEQLDQVLEAGAGLEPGQENQPMTTTDYEGPERRTSVTLADVHEGIVRNAEGMSDLAAAINRSTDVNAALMTEPLRRQSRSRTLWLVILSALVGLVLVAQVWFGYQQWRGAQARDRIEECTTPGRECYDRQAAEGAKAIEQVKRDTEAAVRAGVDQAECDLGVYCPPGMVPRTSPPGTTTTTSPPATP